MVYLEGMKNNHGDLKTQMCNFVHGAISDLHFTVYQWQGKIHNFCHKAWTSNPLEKHNNLF